MSSRIFADRPFSSLAQVKFPKNYDRKVWFDCRKLKPRKQVKWATLYTKSTIKFLLFSGGKVLIYPSGVEFPALQFQ